MGNTVPMSRSDRAGHIAKLRAFGAKVVGDKITLYRGANVSVETIKNLRYGDYLSASESGYDVTGNAGASSYGANCVCFDLDVDDVIVTGAGEFQYKGKSSSLINGTKYPGEIYQAYNDAYGSNYTSQEIDAQDNVRVVASQALSGGSEEFDALLARHKTAGGAVNQLEKNAMGATKMQLKFGDRIVVDEIGKKIEGYVTGIGVKGGSPTIEYSPGDVPPVGGIVGSKWCRPSDVIDTSSMKMADGMDQIAESQDGEGAPKSVLGQAHEPSSLIEKVMAEDPSASETADEEGTGPSTQRPSGG